MSQSAKELKEVLDLLPALAKALDRVADDGKLGLTDISAVVGLYSTVKIALNGLGQIHLAELDGSEGQELLNQAIAGVMVLGSSIKSAYEKMAK